MGNADENFGMGTARGEAATLQGISDEAGILDAVDLPIIVIGHDCRVARINRAATTVLGLGVSDVGRPVRNIAGVKNLNRLCADVIADGSPCRRETRDGHSCFLLRIAPYSGGDGQILGAVLTFTNVTAFRASIDQAIYEREYTKAILNTVIDPLAVLDAELRVQTANRAFYAMFGVSRDETQGVSIRTLGNKDWENSEVWKAVETTLSQNTEFQAVEIDREFPGMGRRTVVLDARRVAREGHALILLAFQDITRQKQSERALRESEEGLRTLASTLDMQVQIRTQELQRRNQEVVRQTEQLRELSNRLLQSQDDERRRVARELHDGVGQLLAAVNMNLSRLDKERYSLSQQARRSLTENTMLIEQALREVRTISHLLHPPLLDDIGLESAIREYVDGFAERSKISVNVQLAPGVSKGLPQDVALPLFRVVQECLINIHRHSGSKTAFVGMNRSSAEITLEVKDEGRGISPEVQAKIALGGSSGVGLRGMRERIQQLGGRLEIDSDGNGTRVSAVLPITDWMACDVNPIQGRTASVSYVRLPNTPV